MDWLNYVVLGVPAAIVVMGLLEAVKRLTGWDTSTRWYILAAVGIGILVVAAGQVSTMFPVFKVWYEVILAGVMIGLMAAGVYDFSGLGKAK